MRPLRPLALSSSLIGALERLGWTPATLPTGAYGMVDRPVETVAMGTSLGFHADVPDEVVYKIVRVVCEEKAGVRHIHAAAAGFDPTDAPRRARGPLHAGAARYFREAGLLA